MPAVVRDAFLGGHPCMLGQQWIYSLIYFPFWINVSDSCWLSRHALRTVPLNISFLASETTLQSPGQLFIFNLTCGREFPWWFVANCLSAWPARGREPSLLTPVLAHLHQSVPHVLCLLLCNTWRRLSHLPAMTMSNDENSLFRHMVCKGVFYLNNNFGF